MNSSHFDSLAADSGSVTLANEPGGAAAIEDRLPETMDRMVKSLGIAWAVLLEFRDARVANIRTCGNPPDIRATTAYVRPVARRLAIRGEWQLHVSEVDGGGRLPSLIAFCVTRTAVWAVALGPKTDRRGYSVSDCTLILDAAESVAVGGPRVYAS